MNGKHKQEMFALHHLIGAAVVSVNQWKGSKMFTQDVVKVMELFGVPCSELLG